MDVLLLGQGGGDTLIEHVWKQAGLKRRRARVVRSEKDRRILLLGLLNRRQGRLKTLFARVRLRPTEMVGRLELRGHPNYQ